MKQQILILIVIATLIGCSENASNDNNKQENVTSDFKDFLDNIPEISLPVTIECGFNTTLSDTNMIKKYSKFIPTNLEVAGKVASKKNLNLILFASIGDIIYPHLYSFDSNGNKIDSVYLHISTCANDEHLELFTQSLITKDITINMTDTAKHFNFKEIKKDYSRVLDSTIVRKKTVVMDNSGKFTISSEGKEKI